MAVAGKATNEAIGAKFDLGRKVIGRHIAQHLRPVTSTEDAAGGVYTLPADCITEPLEVLEAQMARLQAVLGGDLSARDRLDMEKLLTATAAQIARLRPPVNAETPAQDRVAVLEAKMRVWMKVLEAHPDIMSEIVAAGKETSS